MVASEVMAQSAYLLNDRLQAIWTNTVLLPALTKAGEELETLMELNEIAFVKRKSITISAEAADTELDEYPTDFLEPIDLYERLLNSSANWMEMDVQEFEPDNWVPGISKQVWAYRNGKIYFPVSTTDRDIRLRYNGTMTPLVGTGSTVDIPSAKTFLAARAAQIAAISIGNSPTLGEQLQSGVDDASDKLIRRLSKNSQNLGSRRIGYKGRSSSSTIIY